MPQETITIPREWLQQLMDIVDIWELAGYPENTHPFLAKHVQSAKALLNK